MLRDARRSGGFALYAWLVLAYNLLVILWGAVVRATGSGAGCGEHWPLCQGVVIPHGAEIATLIEFAHRASSGVAVVLVIGLVYFGFRSFAPGHAVRGYALAALCFTLTEGLIGAGLVLFGWTGTNASFARFAALAIHLANTFMLLASLALTARSAGWAGAPESDVADRRAEGSRVVLPNGVKPRHGLIYGLAMLATLALAITGTIAALADTLFPAHSLAGGLSQDFSAKSSYIIRLRIIHPLLAVIVGILLLVLAAGALSAPKSLAAKRMALSIVVLVFLQSVLGGLNLVLLAPVAVQVLHLLVADLIWIALILLASEILGKRRERDAREAAAVNPPPSATLVGTSVGSA